MLDLSSYSKVSDAGCAALESGALPALEMLHLHGTPASAAASAAAHAAFAKSRAAMPP